ncbi:MerR family transcriptional regulator [Cellulosimicrobium cellulans]|uniref:MerR family transcriptional regulator n=1 Tax=Cellulosimicrobium cellulans TaxID=1710 RepID=UPI00130EE96C|nr:MerR family transcriptional regulator [Cellulosimicrobium cellulans]
MQHSEDEEPTGDAGRGPGDRATEPVELDGPILTVAAVAARLGVAPATLRTWDRRYGLGPSEHTAGAHRRYSTADLARLMTMRSLTLDGVPPADAARLAREGAPVPLLEPDVPHGHDGSRAGHAATGGSADRVGGAGAGAGAGADATGGAAPDAGAAADGTGPTGTAAATDDPRASAGAVRHLAAVPDARAREDAAAADPRRAPSPGAAAPAAPGGRGARPPRPATPTSVIDAALRADAAEVARLLAIPVGGDLVRWWSDLVAPARAGIASRTVLARPGDEPDALVAAAALAVLRDRSGRVPRHPSRRRIVLLLAAPGEPRPLSLHVLAGALADAGVDARVVAGPTGRHRLLEIAAMTSPSAVVLLSEQTAPDLGLVDAVAEAHAELPVFVMVPDEAAGEVPLGRQVHRVRTVPGLVHEVLAVCA